MAIDGTFEVGHRFIERDFVIGATDILRSVYPTVPVSEDCRSLGRVGNSRIFVNPWQPTLIRYEGIPDSKLDNLEKYLNKLAGKVPYKA
jgi:hypothetical protein